MSAAVTIGLAAALLVAGGAFGSPSLQVPGVALAALALGSVAWAQAASRATRIERAPGPSTITEGEPYPLRIELRCGPVRPRGELRDSLLGEPMPVRGLGGWRRAGRAPIELRADASLERRGRHRLKPPRLIVRDPLGLCTRSVGGGRAAEVLVLPRIEPVRVGSAGDGERGEGMGEGSGEGAGAGLSGPFDVEVDGLRPYRKGSPGSRIHWPAVARHGELIERRLVSGTDWAALVVLDAARPAGPEALDRAVRAAASLCFHLARAGGCTLLVPGAPRPLRIDRSLRGWPQAHARLALVEPGDSLTGVGRLNPAGGAFWVTADGGGAMPRPLVRARSSYMVTPFAPPGGRASFTVAGCHGRPVSAGVRRAAA